MLFQNALYFPFLCACLVIYWLVFRTARARMLFLAAASVVLLITLRADQSPLWVGAASLAGALGLAMFVFIAGHVLRTRGSTLLMIASIVVPLSVLLYFKYVTRWFPPLALFGGAVPVGVSYYTFKHIHYLVESRRGRFADATLPTYLAYIFFFPMFLAGPIERFTNFGPQAGAITWSWAEVSPAVERILVGMAKKFLLVDLLLSPMLPAPTLIADGAPTLHAIQVLAACFLKLLVTYFDFSGYTDMVLGTARLFGFKLIENFDFPLLRSNLAEFWRSWHISLSSWARDYVYLPILGRYRMTGPALLATMLTIGVWHGAQPGWALWGLHHGTGLVLYGNYQRWCESRPAMQRLRNRRTWRLVSMVFVWWFVSLGYALTFTPATFASSTHLYVKALSFGLFG